MENITSAVELSEYWLDKGRLLVEFLAKLGISVLAYVIFSKLIDWLAGRIGDRLRKKAQDITIINYVTSFVKIGGKAVLIITLLGQMGVNQATIVAALGSVGVGISLALQGGAANFAGGVLLLVQRPFKVGDFIREVNEGNEGFVASIGMFYTTLLSLGDRTITIPNSKLTDASVINYTASGFWLVNINIGISYTDDIDLAKSIMRRAFEEEPRVLKNKPIDLLLDSLGDSSVRLEVRGWTTIEDHFVAMWDLTERIKKDFDAAGITIAFNQLDVHMIHENTKLEEKNGRELYKKGRGHQAPEAEGAAAGEGPE
ncbi:MAG: mechanosensitive ion channel family protein [Lachnospiraceae bacterium]|nr:mechanosensitive ion channel family protein [Lachnospiraceae bacterium]